MLKDVCVCPICKILLCLLLFALRFLFGYLFGILLFFFCGIRKAFGTEQSRQLKSNKKKNIWHRSWNRIQLCDPAILSFCDEQDWKLMTDILLDKGDKQGNIIAI